MEIAKLELKGLEREKITNCIKGLVDHVANCLFINSIEGKQVWSRQTSDARMES